MTNIFHLPKKLKEGVWYTVIYVDDKAIGFCDLGYNKAHGNLCSFSKDFKEHLYKTHPINPYTRHMRGFLGRNQGLIVE